MSASAAAARPRASAATAARRLFRNNVLKGGPTDDRKDRVVQGEEAEVAAPAGGDARTHPTDHDRDRKRQEEEREHELPRAAPGRRRRDAPPHHADADRRTRS